MSRVLRGMLLVALGLLLLTPFVVSAGTVFPYVVGKALWSRALIEIAFALWALLAIRHAAYRPPRSWLLCLALAGLGVSALSAAFGVSPQFSLWTSYERMQGVLDQAHWVVLAFVLAATVRDAGAWRVLLGAHTVAGALVVCIVVAGAAGLEVPFYGELPERRGGRAGGPFGNPMLLGVYMLANAGLAVALGARAFAAANRRAAAGWGAAALVNLAGLVLTGSAAALVGMLGAAGFAAFAFAWLAKGRRRLLAAGVLVALAGGTAFVGARFVDSGNAAGVVPLERSASQSTAAAALRYIGAVNLRRPSVQSRLAAWEAGLEGFVDRPWLGWGPGNYRTAFGLFGTGYAAYATPHDQAHNKLVEVAATTGLAGLSVWLATWGLALAVLLRAARASGPSDRAFAVLLAAALAGHLVQAQFLFDTVAGNLFATLLLAFAARLEPAALPSAGRARLPERVRVPLARLLRVFRRRVARAALGAAAVALALCGLVVQRDILAAADNRYVARDAVQTFATADGIEAFPPLAGLYRRFLFTQLRLDWVPLRTRHPRLASRLLAWADREADASARREPCNWRIEQMIAQLYHAVAATDPDYRERARRHLERARTLAPARDPFPEPLQPPGDLVAVPVPADAGSADAEVELRWRPSPGAGYHHVARFAGSGGFSNVAYVYAAEPPSVRVGACAGCTYRIRACRAHTECTGWAVWP